MKRLAAAALLAISPPALSHDLWLSPADFSPAADSPLAIRIMIADTYPGEELPRQNTKLERFELVPLSSVSLAIPIIGRDGGTPAGLVRVPGNGAYAIVYDSAPSRVELDGPKFEAYLREVGLEKIIELRAAKGLADAPARERFSRCAKSLVRVGDEAGGWNDRAVGLELELVLSATASDPARRVDAVLLRNGAPLAGALVTASPTLGGERLMARTDAQGRVGFELPSAGVWNLNAVDMTEANTDAGADWESLWASLSFEWPAGEPATRSEP